MLRICKFYGITTGICRSGAVLLAAVLLLLGGCSRPAAVPPAVGLSPLVANPRPVDGSGGVVAVSEPLAAAAGAAVLAAGGNAVDAAVTIQAMLTVSEPQSSGIGGGGFALVHIAAGPDRPAETVVLDFRETAPAVLPPGPAIDDFRLASTTGAAVGVPATVKALGRALARWGTISLADALAPAIAAAEEGIVVSPRLAEAIARAVTPAETAGGAGDPAGGGRLALHPGRRAWETARAVFAPGGRPPAAGERLRQPDLAGTLRQIAAGGEAAFYDCDHPAGLARAIVETQRASHPDASGGPDPAGQGQMTCADLAGYDVVLRRPVEGSYRGFRIASVPPPSSGGIALLQMLAMLERFPLGAAADGWGAGSEATLTVLQDAMRLAYADRALWLGDPAFFPVPVAGLLDRRYLARRSASCDDPEPAAGRYCLAPGRRLAGITAGQADEGGNTTHFTVADRFGNIVAWTGTIEATWGSGLMVSGYGVLLNNQLTDFNRPPRRSATDPGANDPEPGKRSRSSITPVIVFAGTVPVAALGSPGGATIPNTVLGVLHALIDQRLPLQPAIDLPRLSLTSPADGATTLVEPGFDAAVLARLAALCSVPDDPRQCYRFRETDAIGSVQAVVIDPATGRRQGGADRRRDGTVIALPAPATP